MSKILKYLLIVSILSACTEDNTLTIIKEPGNLTGTVLPLNINAIANLQQGETIKSVPVNDDGMFSIHDVDPGVYSFFVKATNFGSYKKENIKIEDGEGYEIGTIELKTMPFPLLGISYRNYLDRRSNYKSYIIIHFSKFIVANSMQNSIKILPKLENQEIVSNSKLNDHQCIYYIYGDIEAGTNYSITLDSTIQTFWNENLEFPYTYNFTTDPFKIISLRADDIQTAYSNIDIRFNNSVNSDFEKHINIEPKIGLRFSDPYYSHISIMPINSWIPDTKFSITVDSLLSDMDGNHLVNDTTITFTTPPLKVIKTYPFNYQDLLVDLVRINIQFNYLIEEESFINEDCITIEPELVFNKFINISFYNSQIMLIPEGGVQEDTEYTVTINTKLKDYWGQNLKEPYVFKFKTK